MGGCVGGSKPKLGLCGKYGDRRRNRRMGWCSLSVAASAQTRTGSQRATAPNLVLCLSSSPRSTRIPTGSLARRAAPSAGPLGSSRVGRRAQPSRPKDPIWFVTVLARGSSTSKHCQMTSQVTSRRACPLLLQGPARDRTLGFPMVARNMRSRIGAMASMGRAAVP